MTCFFSYQAWVLYNAGFTYGIMSFYLQFSRGQLNGEAGRLALLWTGLPSYIALLKNVHLCICCAIPVYS